MLHSLRRSVGIWQATSPFLVTLHNHCFTGSCMLFDNSYPFAYELPRSNAIYVAFPFPSLSTFRPCYAYFNTNGSPVAGSLQLSPDINWYPLTASVSDTLESPRSLLVAHWNRPTVTTTSYTGIACELTVTAEAHWNQTPYQRHHLLSDRIDHAFIALRQAQRDQLR